jgi:hypothetical protein
MDGPCKAITGPKPLLFEEISSSFFFCVCVSQYLEQGELRAWGLLS